MKMLYQNQIYKIKKFIYAQPNAFIVAFASIYLFPSLFLYFVSEDIKFAVLFKDYSFFENLINIGPFFIFEAFIHLFKLVTGQYRE